MTDPRALLAELRSALADAGARDELLARVAERRVLGVRRKQVFEPVERVWRLGVLLLGRSGTLYATGHTIRVERLRVDNHQSNVAAERRAVRDLALRSGIDEGETLNYAAPPLDLGDPHPPLVAGPGGLRVRWTRSDPDATVALEPYLRERAALLTDPPAGA